MLAVLFACCGLRTRPHAPSERDPLLPRPDDTPTPQPRVIDHQRLKDRLGAVVHAKQRKMVNVNAHSPFGLQDPDHSSASSRNVSGGTLPSSRASSPSPPGPQKAPSIPDADDAPHYLRLAANPILNIRLVKSVRSSQSTRGRSLRNGDPSSHTHPLVPPEQESTPRPHPPAPALQEPPAVHPPESLPHSDSFDIHDAGAVARSWAD